jgi:hypothetical protein
VASQLQGIDHATLSGPTFSFYKAGYNNVVFTGNLTQETLASAPPGAPIFIDDGSGNWRVGVVISDGANTITPSGKMVASSATAAIPILDNNQNPPGSGTSLVLTGTASDGSMWFTATPPPGLPLTIVCGAATTVGGAAGKLAAVQTPDGWQMLQL